MGIGDARYGPLGGLGGSQVPPGLKRKSNPSFFRDLLILELI